MALEYGFYNSLNGDRRYNSAQMGELFEGLITDGVYPSVGEKFAVTPGEGRQILVGTGRAWFNATWSKNRAKYPMDLDIPDPVFDRIDSVCIKVDKTSGARANSFVILKGLVATTAQPPTLPMDNPDITYHPLAYVRIRAASESITASDITILVGTSACPYTTSILQQTNIDELFTQWTDQFMGWWNGLKTILDGDAVGNIMNALSTKLDISAKATPAEVNEGLSNDKYVTPYSVKQYVEGARYEIGDIVCKFGPMEDGDFVRCDGSTLAAADYPDFAEYCNKRKIYKYTGAQNTFATGSTTTGYAVDIISDGLGLNYAARFIGDNSWVSVGQNGVSTYQISGYGGVGGSVGTINTFGFPFSVGGSTYMMYFERWNTIGVKDNSSDVATAVTGTYYYRTVGLYKTDNGADIVFMGHPSVTPVGSTSNSTGGYFYIARFRVSGSAYSLTVVKIADTFPVFSMALVVDGKLYVYSKNGYYDLRTSDIPTFTSSTSGNTVAAKGFLGTTYFTNTVYSCLIKASPNLKHFVILASATSFRCLNVADDGTATYKLVSISSAVYSRYGYLTSVAVDDDGCVFCGLAKVNNILKTVPGAYLTGSETSSGNSLIAQIYNYVFQNSVYNSTVFRTVVVYDSNGKLMTVNVVDRTEYDRASNISFYRTNPNSSNPAIDGCGQDQYGGRIPFHSRADFFISGIRGAMTITSNSARGNPSYTGKQNRAYESYGTYSMIQASEATFSSSAVITTYTLYAYSVSVNADQFAVPDFGSGNINPPPIAYDFWIKVKDSKNLGINGATPML